MSIAMIVRADQGGLGNQTWEMWRHLEPEHTIVIAMHGDARGREHLERYDDRFGSLTVNHGPFLTDDRIQFATVACSTLVSVEGWYNPLTIRIAQANGCRTVLVGNPELYDHREAPDLLLLPTPWERWRTPGAVLQQPVALDRFVNQSYLRRECFTFYHPCAPAMLDRNGTDIVLQALPYVKNPCRVVIRGHRQATPPTSAVTLEWVEHCTDDYWNAYPDRTDVLLLPRRYGGLCLPAFEAAALGIPSLMLDLEPQKGWPFCFTSGPVREEMTYQMKGGEFSVYGIDPQQLATAMDFLIDHPPTVEHLSNRALDWAAQNSWESLLAEWKTAIG